MKGIFNINSLRELFRGDKKITIIIIGAAVLILLLAVSGPKTEKDNSELTYDYESLRQCEEILEDRLKNILSDIEGVGKLDVMVTLESSGETSYGKNEDMLLSVSLPKVRGVIVVCEGGDDIITQEKVVRCISGVFSISSTRISVVK